MRAAPLAVGRDRADGARRLHQGHGRRHADRIATGDGIGVRRGIAGQLPGVPRQAGLHPVDDGRRQDRRPGAVSGDDRGSCKARRHQRSARRRVGLQGQLHERRNHGRLQRRRYRGRRRQRERRLFEAARCERPAARSNGAEHAARSERRIQRDEQSGVAPRVGLPVGCLERGRLDAGHRDGDADDRRERRTLGYENGARFWAAGQRQCERRQLPRADHRLRWADEGRRAADGRTDRQREL